MPVVSMRLYMPCPAKNCDHKDWKDAHHWTHHNCGGDMHIDEGANIFCTKCQTKKFFVEWRWACGHHVGQFQEASLTDVAAILAQRMYYCKDGSTAFYAKLLQALAPHAC